MKFVLVIIVGIIIAPAAEAMAPDFAPCCLVATAVSQSEIDLSWTPVGTFSPSISGYKIERESPVGAGFAIVIANSGSVATTYADKNLAPNATYNYRVSSINSDGVGPASYPPVSATTFNAPNISLTAPPQNLTATPASASEIDLAWTVPQNAPTVLGYKIEREIGIGGGFTAIVANSTVTTYADMNLAPGATYNYRVSAIYASSTSIVSNSASATTLTLPGYPQNVKAIAGNGRATISWNPPIPLGGNIINYVITGTPNGSTTAGGNASSATVTGLTNGVSYYFGVKAANAIGSGPTAVSNSVVPQVTPAPQAQTSATANSSAAIPNAYVFTSWLQKGMRGKAVTELQKRLVASGYLKAEPTGYFGVLTEKAVKEYQIANGLEAVGGVGPLTRAALNSSK